MAGLLTFVEPIIPQQQKKPYIKTKRPAFLKLVFLAEKEGFEL